MSSWVLQWLLLRVVAWLKNDMDDDLGTIIMDGEESSVQDDDDNDGGGGDDAVIDMLQ